MTFFSAEGLNWDFNAVEMENMRNTHEKEKARRMLHRRAMKREKKFVRELKRKCEKYNEPSANYYRYCKRPFAHHKRNEWRDHRVLQANAYPIREQLREMYEEQEMEAEFARMQCRAVNPEEYYDTYEYVPYCDDDNYEMNEYDDLYFWIDETEKCDDAFLWCAESESYYNDFFCPDVCDCWDDDRFWPAESECADDDYSWPDECECGDSESVIAEEIAIMEAALAERQERAECYDVAMTEFHEEEQFVACAVTSAIAAHEQSKVRRRRHCKGNIREKGYVAMLDKKVNSKAKEEGNKPKNFRRHSKRPRSRRYEERVTMHSHVDHRTACANAYPVAMQIRDMYRDYAEMQCA